MSLCPCGSTRARVRLDADTFCPYGDARASFAHQLLTCQSCGLVRTDPFPSDGEHELFRDPTFLETYLEREPLFERFLAPVVDAVARVVPAPGRFVDVGANTGTLVALARAAGYDATGYELNEAGVAFARGRGLPVEAGLLEDADLAPGSLDAVTMSAVAEHLLDPHATFAAAASALRVGGVLVCANSPNLRSLAARTGGEGWYGIQPEGHAWQLTPASLRALIEPHGFRVVRADTFGMERIFGRNRKERVKRVAYRFAESLGFGDALTLVAVRV